MADFFYDDVYGVPGMEALPTYPDLRGKRVFITGGGSGIGAFLTAAFAAQGCQVGFVSLHKEPAERLVDEVEARTGVRPNAAQCDIRNLSELRRTIDDFAKETGTIDVLVNNAARDTRHTVDELSDEQWDDSMATNLRPHFFTVQFVLDGMKKAGGGSIINMGSNSFNLGLGGYPAYVASKGAIVGLTRALARDLGPFLIRANVLTPGWVLTSKQIELWANDEDLKKCLSEQCIDEKLNGWDIAGPTLFLASDSSSMITGQEIIVDGGRSQA